MGCQDAPTSLPDPLEPAQDDRVAGRVLADPQSRPIHGQPLSQGKELLGAGNGPGQKKNPLHQGGRRGENEGHEKEMAGICKDVPGRVGQGTSRAQRETAEGEINNTWNKMNKRKNSVIGNTL